jgi:hypothetical protein
VNAPVTNAQLRDYFGNPRFRAESAPIQPAEIRSDLDAIGTDMRQNLTGIADPVCEDRSPPMHRPDPKDAVIGRLQRALLALLAAEAKPLAYTQQRKIVDEAHAALRSSVNHGFITEGLLPWEEGGQ